MSEAAKAPAQETPKADQGSSPVPAQAADAKPADAKVDGAKAPDASAAAASKEGDGATPKPDAKTPEAQKPTVPAKYDLKMREGSLLDPGIVEKISSFAKEKGLSNEQAQALLDQREEGASSYSEHQKATLAKKNGEWLETIKSDPEFGGANIEQNGVLVADALTKVFGSEFVDMVKKAGLNHMPALFKGGMYLHKAFASDKMIVPGSEVGVKVSPADLLYPTTANKEGA